MKKIFCLLMLSVALLAYSPPANADSFRGGGGMYNMHGGGYRGHGFDGGGRFRGGHGGGQWRHHYRGHDHFRSSIIIGASPVVVTPWVVERYPRYPAVVDPPREYLYVAPPPTEPGYWYYCSDAGRYYPDVQSCPDGWTRVLPPSE